MLFIIGLIFNFMGLLALLAYCIGNGNWSIEAGIAMVAVGTMWWVLYALATVLHLHDHIKKIEKRTDPWHSA